MIGEWCYFKNYLDQNTCKKIIQDVQLLPVQEAHVGVGEGKEAIDNSVRRTKIRFINKGDWKFQYIFDIFWKTAIQANDDFFQFNISRLNFIQFAEYNSNELAEYKPHHDVFWLNNDAFYHRKLSGMIQLSNEQDYDGGNFEIVDASVQSRPPAADIRQQGTILYLPSFMMHQVTPVTRGIRYSLVAWFEGKKWS